MSDLTEKLVDYLIADHKRLAGGSISSAEVEDYRATIAQMEATMQGWDQIVQEREAADQATIEALTAELEKARRELVGAIGQRDKQADTIIQLRADLEVAQATTSENLTKWVTDAFTLWDDDPDRAYKALERAHLTLNPKEEA